MIENTLFYSIDEFKKNVDSSFSCYEHSNKNTLHLTANENLISDLCQNVLSSSVANRYLLEHHSNHSRDSYKLKNNFLLKSFPEFHFLFDAADKMAKSMFSAEHIDLRPLSGLHATQLTIVTNSNPGDLIYCLSPHFGGHFSTTSLLESLGRKYAFLPWDQEKQNMDLVKIASLKIKPKIILLDYADPLYPLLTKELREILGEHATIIYDASHVLGLIAGRCFQNPLQEGCDILIGNTHKTFPGPHKGMIACKDIVLGEKISKQISNLISTQHTHHTLALCVAIAEMYYFGQSYAQAIIHNAKALGKALVSKGVKSFVASNHIAAHVLYCSFEPQDYILSAKKLLSSNISVNARVAYEKEWVRFGVQEVTRRGGTAEDMKKIAEKIHSRIFLEDTVSVTEFITQFLSDHTKCLFSFD